MLFNFNLYYKVHWDCNSYMWFKKNSQLSFETIFLNWMVLRSEIFFYPIQKFGCVLVVLVACLTYKNSRYAHIFWFYEQVAKVIEGIFSLIKTQFNIFLFHRWWLFHIRIEIQTLFAQMLSIDIVIRTIMPGALPLEYKVCLSGMQLTKPSYFPIREHSMAKDHLNR